MRLPTLQFSSQHWHAIVKSLVDRGYLVTNYVNYWNGQDADWICLLRHDVENCPRQALMLAQVEAKLDIHASYYIRVHSPCYNVLSPDTRLVLQEIAQMGHEIGLHTELGDFSAAFGEDVRTILSREKAILEAAVGTSVHAVAPHGDYTRVRVPWSRIPAWGYIVDRESCTALAGSGGQSLPQILRKIADPCRDLAWRMGLDLRLPRLHSSWNFASILDVEAFGFVYSTTNDRFVKAFRHFDDGPGRLVPHDPIRAVGRSPRMVINAHPQWWYADFYHWGGESCGIQTSSSLL